MEDNISKIKERIDIVDLISGHIKLQKAGMNFKACCPFHNEKTPSFYVSPERQIWHCFGCGEGGSIFDFIMKLEGLEFPEALRILAQRAGIELSQFDREFQNEKTHLLEICERATKFFEKQLRESNTGKKALAYLHERGLNEDSINSFQLGFAPDSWDSLFTFLRNSGYSSENIAQSGLILKKERGDSYYDRFRSRIIFPIHDINGQAVGFTGRVFEARPEFIEGHGDSSTSSGKIVPAKYINTPQTALYDKSRILYGLDKARQDIKKNGVCIVVEGNMDVVMSHLAGVKNCVASSGTALTDQHVNILKRYSNNIDLCFDKDSAGQMATDRGVALALSRGFNVNMITIDDNECKDPADYVKKYGAKWCETVKNKKPVIGFYLDQALSSFNPGNVEGKKSIVARLLPFLKSIGNAIEQSHWLEELSLRLKVKESDLRLEMEKAKPVADFGAVSASISQNPPKALLENVSDDILENYAISLVLRKPLWYKDNIVKIDAGLFSESAGIFLGKLKAWESENIDFPKLIVGLDEAIKKKAEVWHLQSQAQWADLEDDEIEKELIKIISYMKKRGISLRLASLEDEIKEAERSGDEGRTTLLVKQFNELSKEIIYHE